MSIQMSEQCEPVRGTHLRGNNSAGIEGQVGQILIRALRRRGDNYFMVVRGFDLKNTGGGTYSEQYSA